MLCWNVSGILIGNNSVSTSKLPSRPPVSLMKLRGYSRTLKRT